MSVLAELAPRSPELRSAQKAMLGGIAATELVAVELSIAEMFAVNYDSPNLDPINTGNPFQRLADLLKDEFVQRAENSGDDDYIKLANGMAPVTGLTAMCRVLSYAPGAYTEYARTSEEGFDINEFEVAIRASCKVNSLFAATDLRRAKTFETDFGISSGEAPTYEPLPFIFKRSDWGNLTMVASPLTKILSKDEIADREKSGDLRPIERHRKCPAYWTVVNGMWQRAVDIAIIAPALFPRSFELAA